MTTTPPHCVPILRVSDARASVELYERAFGFTRNWEHRHETDFPLFVSMTLGGATIFLSEHPGDGEPVACVYIYVDDVDAMYRRCVQAGAPRVFAPMVTPYGMKEVRVRDWDGNELRFGMAVNEKA